MRVCLVYDCLYPYTVGGAERWLRTLAVELAAAGHDVTFVTRKQWTPGEEPEVPGVRVLGVSPGGPLYTASGRRRIWPPVRFGIGVLGHLLRHRRRYDAIHSIAFPYFPLLAARIAAPRAELWVDWFEVWTLGYWRRYVGTPAGLVGYAVQRLCVRLTRRAFVFSGLHAQRLREEGLRVEPIRLAGLHAGDPDGGEDPSLDRPGPLVVFAGRQIAEKRADAIPPAVAAARARVPGLRATIFGDGPERPRVLDAIRATGVEDAVDAPGFVSAETVRAGFARATCHLLPSEREGYGMVVIEAAAAGTPSVVVAGPDNAAAELVEEGANGYVAGTLAELPDLIVRVHEEGRALRERTLAWYRENAETLSARASASRIVAEYARAAGSLAAGPPATVAS